MSTAIKKRLAQLEQAHKTAPHNNMRIIGTELKVTDDPALLDTHSIIGNVVTFYAATKLEAFTQRIKWLDDQKDTIALIGVDAEHRQLEKEAGLMVLDILKEKHNSVTVDRPAELLEAVERAREGGELDTSKLTTEQLKDLSKIGKAAYV